jgi:membrane protein DedA with SNARE-associated domain/rhodanese-related sulfurtransferase
MNVYRVHALPSSITQHEYLILFSVVFVQAIGIPVPAAIALVLAGASTTDPVHFGFVLLISFSALFLGDALLFVLGRQTGWWLLGMLCKFSFDPDTCILRAAESFRRHGRLLLILSKFVPGLSSLSPPLAGSMQMSLAAFLALETAGAAMYVVVWCGLGFMFRDLLTPLMRGYAAGGQILTWLVGTAVAIYLAYHVWLVLRAGSLHYVPRVSATEVARHLYSDLHDDLVVFDARSHGYYDSKAERIKDSVRLEPNTILEHIKSLPRDKEIVLYCTCHREATSLRVARILQQNGFRASVIQGGLRAWKRADLPLEKVPAEDLVLLPTF